MPRSVFNAKPLCLLEIGLYRRPRGAERVDFVDVTNCSFDLGPDLPRDATMGRFHARLPSGALRSAAAAFVEIWRLLPRLRPLALPRGFPTPSLRLNSATGLSLQSGHAWRELSAGWS